MMPSQDRNKKIIDVIERMQNQLRRLQNELRAMKSILLKEQQDGQPHVSKVWEACHGLYDEIMQEGPQSDKPLSFKEIHSKLMMWKKNDIQDKRLAKLPDNSETFAQYVRGYIRAKGLQTHRQRK
ncbi:MAG: hypothetical protein ACM359_18355 [Bacillota bacterium]